MKTIKKYGILCGILLINLFLSNCKKNTNIELEISTSGCYKNCSILDAKLINNILYFNFIKNNKYVGLYKYKLNKNESNKIISLVNSIQSDSLKKEYTSHISDIQTYNTKLKYKDKIKNVFYFNNSAPKEYQNLINFVLNLKKKKLSKTDTVIKFQTRNKVKIINLPPPPNPNK